MSKGLGQKLAIKFTEVLSGDVTGWVPEPVAHGDYFRPIGTAIGSSRYSTTYTYSNAFDGNVTGSYWYTTNSGDQWIQIELAEPTWVRGFRWYVDGYRPNGFDFQGSNDGEIWEDILTNNSPNATGWHEFPTDYPKQYKYYRWTVTSRHSSYLYIYEIELLEAAGNERAFTITGEEYQYVNGPLITKEYKIDKVERYGIVPIWKINEVLQLEVLEYQSGDVDVADSSTLSGSSYTTIANEVEFKKSTTISKIKVKTVTSGTYTLMIKDLANTTTFQTHTMTNQPADTFIDFEINPFVVGIGSQYRIEVTRPSGKAYMVSGLYNGTSWKCLRGLFGTSWFTNYTNAMGFVEQGEVEHETQKIEIMGSISILGSTRVRWLEDKPTGTDITIEYTTGIEQGEWIEVSNGDVITSDANIWFRVTLETTDTSVTPTLQDLWIEEPDAPDDQIRLVMHPQSRFNNVEGPLTVQYDHTKGSLRGRGGPVEGFTETFTPTDLEPKPNPHVAENIEVSAEASVDFIKVTYNQAYADEQITVSASVTVDFIYVGVINP
jgi:hypothetical protein